MRDAGDVRAAVEGLGSEPVGPAWNVGEVLLYESRLSPKGATYTVLERFPLAGEE
jgi:2'-5' RNA ligase